MQNPPVQVTARRTRAGASMIEITVAVAIATALLGAASVMVVRLVGLQRNVETAGQQTLVLSRLARQFRSDVHQSRVIHLDRNSNGTELILLPQWNSQQRVEYTVGPQHLTRKVIGTDNDSREEYRFSSGTTFRFEAEVLREAEQPAADEAEDPWLVRLLINRAWQPVPGANPLTRRENSRPGSPPSLQIPPVPLRIEAVSGGPVLQVGIEFGQTPAAELQAAATEASP